MKVITSSALPLVLVLVACSYASPMFGTGGMMKRKFPGATEMTYRTYREIANSNAAAAASSGAAARTGGSGSGDTAWMFRNVLTSPSSSASSNQAGSSTRTALSFNQQQPSFNQQQPSFNQQQPSFNQQQPSFNQQQPSFNQQQPSFNQQQGSKNQQGILSYTQNSHDTFQGGYPTVFDPQDWYTLQELPYHAPTPLDYDDVYFPQKNINRHYY